MMIMELPVGANQQKKEIALANLNHILDNAHSVRAPGILLRCAVSKEQTHENKTKEVPLCVYV